MDFTYITYELTNEEIKGFFEKIFELGLIRFEQGYVMEGRSVVVESMLVDHVYSSVVFYDYDIGIGALGTLPEKYKSVLEIKGVDKKGGLAHLKGQDLYNEYFSLMLKKAYDLGVLEEYKEGLLEYWSKKLTGEKDKLVNLPVCNEQISKILDSDWVKEFNTYIDKKCDEIKTKDTVSTK